ncbi:hypothetical protein VFPFJ_11559 [Purpureocillium lilacinum]|uniref:Uncharacterized protein n=1 Tax=Purpureocillium lilacinum TaxID=33203 RepID=A0A179F3M1_PURLI|nr:hypothetical protein VFPFJ_11559 [Purpureocillium lilacinum]OAQ59783.1 hypothetical protein VFPFJ_11559 [Purpureocillium lilacinum]
MSIITSGILQFLYDDAVHDIEYKSSEFWQHYLRQEFSDTRIYAVTCEVSPDGSRRRIDAVVKRYDASHHTMSALLWMECKRPSGSIRDVELQALDAAKRCIEADNLLFIYTMTTVGLSFRVWFYEADAVALTPFHGEATFADRTQYIDAASENAWVLPQCLNMVKQEVPLRSAPTLPSQSLADLEDKNLDYTGSQKLYDQSNEYSGGFLPSSSTYQLPPECADAAIAGSAGQQSDQPVQIKVRRETHMFHPDKYIFKDVKGKTRQTVRDEWTQIKHGGRKVWAYHDKAVPTCRIFEGSSGRDELKPVVFAAAKERITVASEEEFESAIKEQYYPEHHEHEEYWSI